MLMIFRSIWDIIDSFFRKFTEKMKERLRDRIIADLEYLQKHSNTGLLKKRLLSMPNVKSAPYHFEYGGFTRGLFQGFMEDGFEIYSSGFFPDDILRDAGFQVAERLVEKYDLKPIEITWDGDEVVIGLEEED